MPNTIAVNNMEDAVRAQAQFVSEYTARIAEHGYGDDDVDYLPGALELLIALQNDHYEGAVTPPAATASLRVIDEYSAYAGDFGPQSVFQFLGKE